MKHVFALAAYGESPYLTEALASLLSQEEQSETIVCTSSPNDFIREAAERSGAELFVREGESSLAADWNFCLTTAAHARGAEIVTVAHQDDVYRADYSLRLLEACERYPDISLFCSGFHVIDEEGRRRQVSYEPVKKLLTLPLRVRALCATSFVKRLPLIYGNAICAPTCAYRIEYAGTRLFPEGQRFVTDWRALLWLAGESGRFVMDYEPLIDYRVHAGAETKKVMDEGLRAREEYLVLRECHTEPVAKALMHFYKLSYSAYQ